MHNRWLSLVGISLLIFASLVTAWQIVPQRVDPNQFLSFLVQSCIRGEHMAAISDIVERDSQIIPASGTGRQLSLVLPNEARIFMPDMTGPLNNKKMGFYYFATYYLFPREVEMSLDHVTHMTNGCFFGRTSESDQEILASGFNVRVDIASNNVGITKPLGYLALRDPVNPVWFDSYFDLVLAFLLPLLTALAGMWLFRFLFSTLGKQMPLLEQLACSLGLGMMAVAALTLGIKLCGFHGWGLIFSVAAGGSIVEIWHNRNAYLTGITDGFRNVVHRPVTCAILVTGTLVFLILFRGAGLQGLAEKDAVMAWLLKAKIMHLYTGSELVQWFSNPRLIQAHLDYPTLVPSLHAATYDSFGHVDEFVTKFWPTWMMFFLLAALASLNRGGTSRFHAPGFALLGLLLLPATQKYIQMEGGTLPMIFFTVMGFVQCAFWLVGRDRSRLGLGLMFLFGAAMAKFEGFIFLALVGSWMLLLPSARPSLKPSPNLWRALAFCCLAALPFACLRVQIPSLHFESGWAGYALHNPGGTLSNWPGIFMILLARFFVSSDFASWSVEAGQLHWNGRWDGFSSLYNHMTLGLAWLCLFMTVALWFAVPARRQVVIWTIAMLVGALAAFSVVFASFVNITSLAQGIGYTTDGDAGRYLLPILFAWFTTILTMFFGTALPRFDSVFSNSKTQTFSQHKISGENPVNNSLLKMCEPPDFIG